MAKQKKPKTGDVVGWVVYDISDKLVAEDYSNRRDAKDHANYMNRRHAVKDYRIAKIVLSK